jgi:preprotein translocase subunit SecG
VHYLPLTPGLFSILVFLAVGLIILVQLRILKIGGLGAPVASIGGAGTFDGIFLTRILAVLLAGIASPSRPRPAW